MIPRSVRPYLRAAAIAAVLVPVALVARALYSDHLMETVQRLGARAWQKWMKDRQAAR